MISFKNLPKKDKIYDFYIPEDLKADVIYYLKQAEIPYKSIPWDQFSRIDANAKRAAIIRYQSNDCKSNLNCMGILQIPIEPNLMFYKVCKFFGKNMDPDFKKQQETIQKKSDEIFQTCYEPWLHEGEFPITE